MSNTAKNFREKLLGALVSVFVSNDEKSKANRFIRFVSCVDVVFFILLAASLFVILFVPLNVNTVSLFIAARSLIDICLVPTFLVNIFLLFAA